MQNFKYFKALGIQINQILHDSHLFDYPLTTLTTTIKTSGTFQMDQMNFHLNFLYDVAAFVERIEKRRSLLHFSTKCLLVICKLGSNSS